ncbi:serine hydrolase [Maritimibacter sp. DP1N21-5]|uniref:serine hydrolase domain-containing protein n=1 Tax=Maritimibacter sp. DP1N21-5 TaxID=2836867 RepID=UPI001C469E55|nr:serine hydrolase [Maritimibacter sp. DP1N21-5]MBV7408657.1 beta-lactamase family protein [Maritimibacter sp. DP1N21-5]
MRRILLWGLLVFVLAGAALGVARQEELTRLLAVNTLFDEEKIVHNFSHMGELFHSKAIQTSGKDPSPLPRGDAVDLPDDLDRWLADRATTGIVVLSGGEIVFEDYFLGTGPDDLRISWSVAKSFLSALLGTVIEEGVIESLDDPVVKYAPLLQGSAYEGATIRQVAQMSSGVVFDEDYLDFWSDINRMGRVLALGGSLDRFTADLTEARGEPGADWLYVSMDTHVLGMVIRGATGRDVPTLMGERIIGPLGLESQPYYVTDSEGVAFVLGGLNMMTRDYARFGQMIAQDGMWQGQQIVPADWIDASLRATAPTADGAARYGLQWWLPADAREGEAFAIGVYGQYIWIDRAANVVIAINAADRTFEEPGVFEDNITMLRRITETVKE